MASRRFKTTVCLERAELEALRRIAKTRNESVASVVRRAIHLLAEQEAEPHRPRSLGCVNSGGLNLSRHVDEALAQWATTSRS